MDYELLLLIGLVGSIGSIGHLTKSPIIAQLVVAALLWAYLTKGPAGPCDIDWSGKSVTVSYQGHTYQRCWVDFATGEWKYENSRDDYLN